MKGFTQVLLGPVKASEQLIERFLFLRRGPVLALFALLS